MNKNKTRRKSSLDKKKKRNLSTTARNQITKFMHNKHAKTRNSILYNAAIQLLYNELPKNQKLKLRSVIGKGTIGTYGSSRP